MVCGGVVKMSFNCDFDRSPSGTITLSWEQLGRYAQIQKDLDVRVMFDGTKPAICYRTDGGWGYGDIFIDTQSLKEEIKNSGNSYWRDWCPEPKPCPHCRTATIWPFVLAGLFSMVLIVLTFFVGRHAGIRAGEKLADKALGHRHQLK